MIFSPKRVSKQSLVVNAQLVELVYNCKYLRMVNSNGFLTLTIYDIMK